MITFFLSSPLKDYVTMLQDTERDNSSLFDRNTVNQKLGQEEVEALKQSGKVKIFQNHVLIFLCAST